MTSFLKSIGVPALVALLVAGAGARAEAAPIITVVPSDAIVGLDTSITVDLVVSGLDGTAAGAVGGFSALLSFDDSLITGVAFLVDPDDKMGVAGCAICDGSFGFTGAGGSPLDLFFGADPALDGAALAALQGTGFTLATISFTSLFAEGLSPLSLSVVGLGTFLTDAEGFELASSAQNSSVCVSRDESGDACQSVPEPALMSLLGAGIATLAIRRRRTSRVE